MNEPYLAVAPEQSEGMNMREDHHQGPLKKVIANSDSLYKYINWEDPVRTAGSYVLALSALMSVHYLPLTQFALKYGAITLGVVSATEYAHRSFTSNTILARMRPQQYKRIPESTLNDTLRDVHDLLQYAAVKVQRILFAQNLSQTFYAFVAVTSLYWLIKFVPPFGLAIIALNSIYIAPLLASPRGREVAQDLADTTKVKATELSNKAQATAADTQRQLGKLTTQAQNKAAQVTGATKQAVNDLPQKTSNLGQQTAESTKATADDAKNRIHSALYGDSAPNVYDNLEKPSSNVSSTTRNATDTVSNMAGTATETVKQYAPNSLFDTSNTDTNPNNTRESLDKSTTNPFRHEQPTTGSVKTFDLASTSSGLASQAAPFGNSSNTHYTLEPTAENSSAPSSIPRDGAVHLGPISSTVPGSVGEQPAVPSVLDRPRGVTKLPEISGL